MSDTDCLDLGRFCCWGCHPHFRVILKDIKTGETITTDDKAYYFHWAEGNGSCDCDRAYYFHNEDEDCKPYPERYLIIGIPQKDLSDNLRNDPKKDKIIRHFTYYANGGESDE